jgi:nitrite reductase (NADH) large subunit
VLLLRDPLRQRYKKLVLRHGRLVGACLYGDVRDGAWYFELIRTGTPVNEQRDTLVFGPQVSKSA